MNLVKTPAGRGGTRYPVVVFHSALSIWCLLIDIVDLHGNRTVPSNSACTEPVTLSQAQPKMVGKDDPPAAGVWLKH